MKHTANEYQQQTGSSLNFRCHSDSVPTFHALRSNTYNPCPSSFPLSHVIRNWRAPATATATAAAGAAATSKFSN